MGKAVMLKSGPIESMFTTPVILDCGNEQVGFRTATSVR
jgi:hypothetical protein